MKILTRDGGATRCIESRPLKDGTRRRRYKRPDGTKFTTIEMPAEEWDRLRVKAFRFERLRLLVVEELAV